MFYKDLKLPLGEMGRSFKLVGNLLQNADKLINELADKIIKEDAWFSDYKDNNHGINFKKGFTDSFVDLPRVYRQFRIELVTDAKALFIKLEEVGLTGDIVNAKFFMLDWWYSKMKESFKYPRRKGNERIFDAFIDLLIAILKSICNAIGFSFIADIWGEGLELLKSIYQAKNS